jgi:YD repeat-containing protein
MTDRDGAVTATTYDARNNPVKMVDAAGKETDYVYDGNDNLISKTLPLGAPNVTRPADCNTPSGSYQILYCYNPDDQGTQVSGPGASESDSRTVTSTSYNSDGTKASQTNPFGAVTTYDYFADQSVKQVTAPATSAKNAVTTYSYDSAGRASAITLPETTASGTAHSRRSPTRRRVRCRRRVTPPRAARPTA